MAPACLFLPPTRSSTARFGPVARPLANARGFHEKAGLCQGGSRLGVGPPLLIQMRLPTNGRHDARPVRRPPFPHSGMRFFGREEICQGRLLLPAKRTLDRFAPFRTIKAEGKGPGGLRGLVPLAEDEAAPHARFSAPSIPDFQPFLGTVLCPIVFHARSIATLPSAL